MNKNVLEIKMRSQGTLAVIELIGEISSAADEILNRAYEDAIRANPGAILINFSKVDYINSTGIALILNLLVKAGRSHRRLVGYGLSDHYRELFRITRLADFMRIVKDEAAAMAAL
jgi:anti-sigma B factor antagonist